LAHPPIRNKKEHHATQIERHGSTKAHLP
jgi:hypothetical protein